ncbi:MAG: phage holin family protein [Bacilli bacterium]|nr:phage holin family protein [Bacilli bacterium]
MTKIYKNGREIKTITKKDSLTTMILELIVSALTLMLASTIFKGFYIENFMYAILTALLISVLNAVVRPFLIMLTLPLTILSFGLFYPVVNLIILKLASALMGDSFIIKGWFLPFFIAIFISIVTETLNTIIIKPIRERR